VYKFPEIPPMTFAQFKEGVYKGAKSLIKTLVPSLFTSPKIKDMVFVCLDSFQDEKFRNKQFAAFAIKMYKEIDEPTENFSINSLGIVVDCLEAIISKHQEIIK
jgi:hypothetical protein